MKKFRLKKSVWILFTDPMMAHWNTIKDSVNISIRNTLYHSVMISVVGSIKYLTGDDLQKNLERKKNK